MSIFNSAPVTEDRPDEHGGIELSAAHVRFTQARATQRRVGHQRELHLGFG